MKAVDLYQQLEHDFVKPGITERWYENKSRYKGRIKTYICDNFKQRSMGLLCDFTQEINQVYTAVFPNDSVLQKIIDDGTSDAMLFLHHPLAWDINNPKGAFMQINIKLLKQLKKRRVSLFNFHLPLDNFSEYSTSKTLADALGITIERPFAPYHGAMSGAIGTTDCGNIHALNEKYTQAVGHKTRLYQYGESKIIDGKVGICAGGGNDLDVVEDLIKQGVHVLITGISVNNAYHAAAHALEQEHKINLIGGTHYSSEKFACIAMCNYFAKYGLSCAFIADNPCFEDM